jgi:prepilin-type N-terminal cleavage/methylation domain-containing protein
MKYDSKKGFTIIELLGVVVVVAIISLIAMAIVFSIMKNAKERQYKTNLDSMKSSVKLFAGEARNGLSKINNALVYKDDNGKTWKIGCKKDDSNNRECCIKMNFLKDLGYLQVTDQDMCGDNQKCIDYSSNIFYSGNSIDVELLYGVDNCEIIKYEVVYHSVVKINDGNEGIIKDHCEYNKECQLKEMPQEFKVGYPGHSITNWEDRRGDQYEPGSSKDFTTILVSNVLDLFAKWKNNEFTFTYHGNGSTSGTMEKSKHTFEDGSSLTPNAFSKIGYNYLYWNDQANGSGRKYEDMEPVSDNTFDDGTNINLYAQWEPKQYNVSLISSYSTTGSNPTSVIATYDSSTLSSSITNPQRIYTITFEKGEATAISSTSETSTWTFDGWYSKTSGGKKVIDSNGKLVKNVSGFTDANGNWKHDGDVTLYAQWVDGKITIPTATKIGYTWGVSGVTKPPTANKSYSATCKDDIKPTITCTKSNTGKTSGVTFTCTCSDDGTGVKTCAGKPGSSAIISEVKSSTTYKAIDNANNQSDPYNAKVIVQPQQKKQLCKTGKSCTNSCCGTTCNPHDCNPYDCHCETTYSTFTAIGGYDESSGGPGDKQYVRCYQSTSCYTGWCCTVYNRKITCKTCYHTCYDNCSCSTAKCCGCKKWNDASWANASSCKESTGNETKISCRTVYN